MEAPALGGPDADSRSGGENRVQGLEHDTVGSASHPPFRFQFHGKLDDTDSITEHAPPHSDTAGVGLFKAKVRDTLAVAGRPAGAATALVAKRVHLGAG